MDPISIPLEEFLRDPDSSRSRFGEVNDLIVVSAGEYTNALEARERTRLVDSIREAVRSLERGEGILLEDLEAEYADGDARADDVGLRVRLSPAARLDIAETYAYIVADSGRERAVRWRSGLVDAIRSLDEMPFRFPLAAEEELSTMDVRQLVYLSHRVLYRVGEEVQILRIPHTRRDRLRPENLP